jgi:hypothetical protein
MPGQNGAAATTAAQSSWGATPAAYQQNAYPKTPYEQAKIASAPGSANWGTSGASPSIAAYSAPAANGGLPNTSMNASMTAYGANQNPPAATVQPQNGLYTAPPMTNSYAGSQTAAAMPNASGTGSMPSYQTADARGAMPATMPTDPNAIQQSAAMGDRYAAPAPTGGYGGNADPAANTPAASAPMNAAPATGMGDRYAQPTLNYRSDNTTPGNTGYQPGLMTNPPGNTGYNPPNAYAPTNAAMGGAAMPAAATLPMRPDPGYRPAGTSDYTLPAGTVPPPTSAVQPSGHVSFGVVTPASYQVPVSAAASSSEVYGAYQGASASEPAYTASNPYAAQPGLLPIR